MQEENLISANEFCLHYNIEVSFIQSLEEYGLIQITTSEEGSFIAINQLGEVEKLMRLHYDLNINFEGIDAITHLLKKLQSMEDDMLRLKNKLRLYEMGDKVS
jgi:hypothetical protein